MSKTPEQGGYISQAWLVILLALLYGGALAGVQTTLGPIIEQNKKSETLSVVPMLLLPADVPPEYEVAVERLPANDADDDQRIVYRVRVIETPAGASGKPAAVELMVQEVEVEDDDGNKQLVYRATATDGTLSGWVLPAGGQGFADRIELLIGLDAELETITGMYVLDQKETPGLGDSIRDKELFRDQFAGKSTIEPLLVVKISPAADNKILALTGATISSESVATIVNDAIALWKEPIRQLGSSPASTPHAAPQKSGD